MSRTVESNTTIMVTYACGHSHTLKISPPTWYVEEICRSSGCCDKCERQVLKSNGKNDNKPLIEEHG